MCQCWVVLHYLIMLGSFGFGLRVDMVRIVFWVKLNFEMRFWLSLE